MSHRAKPDPRSKSRMVIDFDLLRRVAGANFRDLGGHPVQDGRRVQRGRIYRSAHVAELPEGSPLKSIGLRTLVTLQSRVEVNHLGPPNRELLDGVRWEHIPIGDRWFEDREYAATIRDPERVHLTLVTHFRQDWRAFFKLLAERNVYPLLFHCSAGRDRTGVGATMILELLGVDRERIVADFLQSNVTFPKAPLLATQLDPLFELIDQSGGAEDFMRNVIGLRREDIAAIRDDLLEG